MKNKNILKILIIFIVLFSFENFNYNILASSSTYLKSTSFSSVGNFIQIIFLLLIFIIILILAYYTTRKFANYKIRSMKRTNINIIETISIGFNNIHILKVGQKYFLISSSKDRISLLAELDDNIKIQENDINKVFTFEENLKNYFEKVKGKAKDGGKDEK